MGKPTKSTKKFQAKHLKRTLDHRKEVKKHKQLLAKHKKGKGKGNSDGVAKIAEEEKENPFDVDTDSEDEKTDFGVIDKKGKNEVISEDDDIFDELDQMADEEIKSDDEEEGNDELEEGELEEEEEEDDDDEQEQKEEQDEEDEQSETDKIEVTVELVKQWDNTLTKEPSLKIIKNVTQAFKSAVNVHQNGEDGMTSTYKYFVTREGVFNKLLFLTLKKLPVAIQKLYPLGLKYNKEHNIQVRQVKNSSKLKQLSAVLKLHAFSLITLLSDITRTNLNLRFILLTLSSIYDIFPYLLSFRTLLKKIVGALVGLWSTLIMTSSGENMDSFLDINMLAFSVILNLSKEYSSNVLETIINGCYEGFLKRALTLSSSISLDSSTTDLVAYKKLKLVDFLKTGLIDLFKIDVNLSYQIAFKYIRKLSIHLRNFLKKNSNIKNDADNSKNLRLIYNWQFIQSLDFWTRFLADVCNNSKKSLSLNELIYPVVQLSLGTMKLNNNSIYFPLKFYLFESLTYLSSKTMVYIPLFNIFIELLQSSIFNKNFSSSKASKKNSSAIQTNAYMNTIGIKVSKTQLNTSEYQLYVINHFLNSLQNYLSLYLNSLAFPEFSFVIAKRLRQFTKKHASVHKKNKVMIFFIKEISNLTVKINENAKFVTLKREHLERFDPINVQTLKDVPESAFPLYKFLKAKQDVLEAGNKLHQQLLLSEQINDASGANDRKKSQQAAGEEYFGKESKSKVSEDVNMDSDDEGSSTTGSI